MDKNTTAVLQMREHLQNQVTIKKWSLNRMDSIQPHSRLFKCSHCHKRKLHHIDPPGIVHGVCLECEQLSHLDTKPKPCCKCGEKPRVSGKSRCQDCYNEWKRNHSKRTYDSDKQRDYNLRAHFNITQQDYDLMFRKQKGLCAVCGKAETKIHPWTGKVWPLCVDHNHETGDIRELLCFRCNTTLGLIERDRGHIKKMLRYLKKHDM